MGEIYLETGGMTLGLVPGGIVDKPKNPLIDKDPYGPKGYVEYDGVKVTVK
jgi:hypothetical protein